MLVTILQVDPKKRLSIAQIHEMHYFVQWFSVIERNTIPGTCVDDDDDDDGNEKCARLLCESNCNTDNPHDHNGHDTIVVVLVANASKQLWNHAHSVRWQTNDLWLHLVPGDLFSIATEAIVVPHLLDFEFEYGIAHQLSLIEPEIANMLASTTSIASDCDLARVPDDSTGDVEHEATTGLLARLFAIKLCKHQKQPTFRNTLHITLPPMTAMTAQQLEHAIIKCLDHCVCRTWAVGQSARCCIITESSRSNAYLERQQHSQCQLAAVWHHFDPWFDVTDCRGVSAYHPGLG
jgi:hypothetical protein